MNVQAENVDQAVILGRVLIAILPLSVIANLFIAIWNGRRRPAITEELYRDFATKKELSEIKHSFDKTMSEFFTRQHQDQRVLDDKLTGLSLSLGRIEGELRKCPTICGTGGRQNG